MSAPRDTDLSAIEEIRSRTGIGPTVRATVKAANVDELAALIEQTDSDRVDLLEIVDRLLSAPDGARLSASGPTEPESK